MKQKVLISAALLHDPDLLIFDEPESGLDVTSIVVLRHLIRLLAERGKAILYSSHVLEAVEKVCKRVIVIHHGRVVANDSIDNLGALMRTRLARRDVCAAGREARSDRDRPRHHRHHRAARLKRIVTARRSVFDTLTRLFLRRFPENDLIAPGSDRHDSLAIGFGVLLTISVFLAFALSTKYLLQFIQLPGPTAHSALSDRFFLIAFSMTVTALVTLLLWDALGLEPAGRRCPRTATARHASDREGEAGGAARVRRGLFVRVQRRHERPLSAADDGPPACLSDGAVARESARTPPASCSPRRWRF